MMGPIAAIESVVFKYFRTRGRATRAEYWWWGLFQFLALMGFVAMDVMGFDPDALPLDSLSQFRSPYFMLLTVVPNVTVTIRRLHDTGRSGFWYFITMVPIVGPLWFLFLMVLPSEKDDNIYGPFGGSGPSRGPRLHPQDSRRRHDPMQGYAVLERLRDEPTPEMIAQRQANIHEYYKSRVLGTQANRSN